MKFHVQEQCAQKKFHNSHGLCKDCGNHFKKFEAYEKHLIATGHMNHHHHIPKYSEDAMQRPYPPTMTSSYKNPSSSSSSSSYVSHYGLPSQCSSMNSSPSRTPMMSPARPMRAIAPSTLYSPPPPFPTTTATTEPRQFLLQFASVVHPEFQMGASAWCLQDLFGTVIAQNAMPMKQDCPSVARGEYEGLLHGLEVARSLNVKNLIIQCSSEIIAAHLSGQTNLLFHTMYNQIEDLIPSIQFLLNKFQKVVVDLVSVGACSHVLRLAEDTT